MDHIARSAMNIDPNLTYNNHAAAAAPAAHMISSSGRLPLSTPQLASMAFPQQQMHLQAQQSMEEQANKISLPGDRTVSFDLKSFLKQHNEVRLSSFSTLPLTVRDAF